MSPLAESDSLSVLDRLAFARAAETIAAFELAEASYMWVRDNHFDWVRGAAFLRDFLSRQGRARDAERLQLEIDREVARRNPQRSMRRL
jgi:hypothetical protein